MACIIEVYTSFRHSGEIRFKVGFSIQSKSLAKPGPRFIYTVWRNAQQSGRLFRRNLELAERSHALFRESNIRHFIFQSDEKARVHFFKKIFELLPIRISQNGVLR